MFYLVVFYIGVFSLIPHKEYRFLTSVVPFLLVMTAFAIHGLVFKWPRLVRLILWLYVVAEVGTFLFLHCLHFRMWETMYDLAQLEVAPHSIYTMQAMDVPYYTWTHRQSEHKTHVLSYKKDPVYARRKLGVPIQILHDHNYNGCLTMLDKLIR